MIFEIPSSKSSKAFPHCSGKTLVDYQNADFIIAIGLWTIAWTKRHLDQGIMAIVLIKIMIPIWCITWGMYK